MRSNAIVYDYDLRGRKTYEGGATYPVRYTYDIFGNKVTMTTYRDVGGLQFSATAPQGDVTTWLYDIASGSMTNKVYADGKGPTYSYTPDGKLAQRTWARGIVTDYSYDNWGSLTNTAYSDNTPTVSLAYDVLVRQIEARDAAGITTFLYDSFGSLTNETIIGVAGTNSIDRFCDNFGRDTGYALNGVRQSTLGYDSATARLLSMQISRTGGSPIQDEATFSWSYLPGSDLKSSLAYPNGLSVSWAYDAKGQLLQVCNATPTNIISQYDYTYDAAGRRVSCAKSGSAFAQDDTVAYSYNNRSELTNAVAAVDAGYRYAYDFDDIGNRETSSECGTNSVYTANSLNQYTAVDDFTSQFDDDGNQTLIKTTTGIWQVQYNGENRPVQWSNGATNITMKFDRMGRRVEYVETANCVTNVYHRFVYDGYLCIQRLNAASNNVIDLVFGWDPSEPVATRPLVLHKHGEYSLFYTHDGNKNVSELVFFQQSNGVAAHYEYAPFGAVTATSSNTPLTAYSLCEYNPYMFSSEYHDCPINIVYYNYRHYIQMSGQWTTRDPTFERGGLNLYSFTHAPLQEFDIVGLAKFLCIMSSAAGKYSASFDEGHAMLFYYETDSSGSVTISNTYGLWPDDHLAIIIAGLSNPTNSDLRTNFYLDDPNKYKYCHWLEIDDKMECKLKCILKQNHSWRHTNNCASFASETFEEVTGVDIDADDWFGFETPREIGDSILRANRGTMSNTGAIPKAPNNIHSSQSIGGK